MLSDRQSHRTLFHYLDALLLGVASSHRALEEGSLLVLDKSISGLKQGSKCIHFLVHVVVVMVPLVLGGAYFSCPPACGFLPLPLLGHGSCHLGTKGIVIDLVVWWCCLDPPSDLTFISFLYLNNYWIFGKLASGAYCLRLLRPAVVRWFTTSHSELSTRSRGLKFLSVGMVRIFYLT